MSSAKSVPNPGSNGPSSRAKRTELEPSTLEPRNIRVDEHRTSVRLEPPMWQALEEIGAAEKLSIHEICTRIDHRRLPGTSLSSAIRIFVMAYFRAAAAVRQNQTMPTVPLDLDEALKSLDIQPRKTKTRTKLHGEAIGLVARAEAATQANR
ncbi:MAG: ribbon-helix-helix domain-containing protein [Azospirillaceae bacterium]|nr:ribbon-helix-helix domain-containing protein [Azospirillaceae bacterium]